MQNETPPPDEATKAEERRMGVRRTGKPGEEAKKEPPPKPSANDRKHPEEWRAYVRIVEAAKLGLSECFHASASVIHGWRAHEHNSGKAIRLSLEDYEAALVAAQRPNERGVYVPHPAALSEFAPKRKADRRNQ